MRLVMSFLVAACVMAGGVGLSAQQSGAAWPLTERELISRLMAADPRVRALQARVDEVRATLAERTLWPNPSVTLSRESVAGVHDTFLLGRQELAITGQRRSLQDASRFAVDAAEADARHDTRLLQADARDAYVGLLVTQARHAELQRAIADLREIVRLLRVREEGGEGSMFDRLRGERALADLEADRALETAALALAQGELALFLGPGATPEPLVAADPLEAPAPLPTVPALPSLIESALVNRGDVRSAELSIARFDAERSAADARRIPVPTLTGGLKRAGADDVSHSGYLWSLDFTVPVFNRGQAASTLATAQKTMAESLVAHVRLRIETEVRAAHTAWTIHQSRAATYRASVDAVAEPLARIGRVAYQEGEISMLELLDAQRQALDARLRTIDLLGAVRRAAIALDRVTGREFRP